VLRTLGKRNLRQLAEDVIDKQRMPARGLIGSARVDAPAPRFDDARRGFAIEPLHGHGAAALAQLHLDARLEHPDALAADDEQDARRERLGPRQVAQQRLVALDLPLHVVESVDHDDCTLAALCIAGAEFGQVALEATRQRRDVEVHRRRAARKAPALEREHEVMQERGRVAADGAEVAAPAHVRVVARDHVRAPAQLLRQERRLAGAGRTDERDVAREVPVDRGRELIHRRADRLVVRRRR
jgi:hypothetical protein